MARARHPRAPNKQIIPFPVVTDTVTLARVGRVDEARALAASIQHHDIQLASELGGLAQALAAGGDFDGAVTVWGSIPKKQRAARSTSYAPSTCTVLARHRPRSPGP